ncbi:unnamed protein product [Camellia sinensis]
MFADFEFKFPVLCRTLLYLSSSALSRPKTSATTISSARVCPTSRIQKPIKHSHLMDPKLLSNQRHTRNTTNTICSSFVNAVCLHDWWLIKLDMDSNGRTLGVGGLAFRERQTIRAFYSVAIAKRHDTVTLETADGITITITSFINRSITLENGFPAEVCNHFLFGFPCYWEEYAGRCFVEESINRSIPSRISSFDGFDMSSDDGTDSLPISLGDLPVTRVRDLLMSSVGDSGNCVLAKSLLNDILRKYGSNDFKHDGPAVQSNMQSNCPGMTMDSVLGGTPCNSNRTMGKQKREDNNGSNPLMTGDSVCDGTPKNQNKTEVDPKVKEDDKGIEESENVIPDCEMGLDVNSSRRVTTRSMARLNNSSNKRKRNLSLNTRVTCRLTEPFSASETSGDQCGQVVNRGNASRESCPTILLSDAEIEAKETPDNSTSRRPSSLKSSSDLFSTTEASKNQCGVIPRRNGSNLTRNEMELKQITDKSAVRRSRTEIRRERDWFDGTCSWKQGF